MKFLMQIPNILTFINISLGVGAILIVASPSEYSNWQKAVVLVLFGAFVDFLDGFIARKLKATSEMGKQFDSFADLITFGVAPIVILNYIFGYSVIILIATLVYISAAVFRLARYNLNDFSKHFQGLPITAAGVILVVFCIIFNTQSPIFATILLGFLGFAMVSKFEIKRLFIKN